MGLGLRLDRAQLWALAGVTVAISVLTAGCQFGQPAPVKRTPVEHIDLLPVSMNDTLKVSWSLPYDWKPFEGKKSPLYSHMQFRSPSLSTGFGVAYVHMPLPLSAKAIVWFAKSQYTSQSSDGRLIGEWTDKLGRYWFEAENAKYHVKGYAVTRGFEAWIVYSGYRMSQPKRDDDVRLANQAADSVIPLPLVKPGGEMVTQAPVE